MSKSINNWQRQFIEIRLLENYAKIDKILVDKKTIVPLDKNIVTLDFHKIKNKRILLVDQNLFDFFNLR